MRNCVLTKVHFPEGSFDTFRETYLYFSRIESKSSVSRRPHTLPPMPLAFLLPLSVFGDNLLLSSSVFL